MAENSEMTGSRLSNVELNDLPLTSPKQVFKKHDKKISILPTILSQHPNVEARLRPLAGAAVGDDDSSTEYDSERTPRSATDHDKQKEPEPTLPWKTYLRQSLFGLNKEEKKKYDEYHGHNRIVHEKIEDFPKGLPRLAAYQDSNPCVYIYRKFGRLFKRNLLHLEIRLGQIEEKLDSLDRADERDTELEFRLRGYENYPGWNTAQKELLAESRQALHDYGNQIEALDKPRKNHYMSLFYFINDEQPIAEEYERVLLKIDDFVTVSGESSKSNRTQDFLEWVANRWPNSFIRYILETDEDRRKTDNPRIRNYSDTRLEGMAAAIHVVLSLISIVAPVFILVLVPMPRAMMACTIAGFAFLFSLMVSALTEGRVHDIFLGTAGYCAVLIAILGNTSEVSILMPAPAST
ncbi:hypothetical protein F5884DRAFT_854818 [Xylogone sp. PMI_703]|nr:hypothetical protein F5884DRAFT_854818 [Xylogone sp. PMI_703]